MKLFILIVFIVGAIIGTLIYRLFVSSKKIKQLRKDRGELITEKSKQLDQLRQKGIEIDELKKELKKYSDVEPKIALSGQEKRMILNALEMSQYKARVQDPATRYFIRQIYINLKEKVKESIKE